MISHCQLIGLFGPEQHAFLKQRSTASNLLEAYHKWVSTIDTSGSVDIVYLDLKKAFNSICHAKLLEKLWAIGVRGELYLWFKDYLFNRRQRVKINDAFSIWRCVTSGVPQGSILGPILFLIYISDLPACIAKSAVSMYADDTKIYFGIPKKGLISDMDSLQLDLNNVSVWLNSRQLTLSLPKCTVLHCGSDNPNAFYYLSNTLLVPVNNMRDLGVLMCSNLKFGDHVSAICRKSRFTVNSILHNFINTDQVFLTKLFNVYARPSLEYCSVVWNSGVVNDILTIEAVQRNFTGKLLGRHLSYRNRLEHLNLELLVIRRLKADLVMVFKIIKGQTILDSNDFFVFSTAQTRGHRFKLIVRRYNNVIMKNSFSCRVVNAWNSLPDVILETDSSGLFRLRLDKYHYDTQALFHFTGLSQEQLESLLDSRGIDR